MKKFRIFSLLFAVILLLSACNGADTVESTQATTVIPTTAPTEPAPDPVKIYLDAVDTVLASADVNYTLNINKQIFVDTQVFDETASYSLSCHDLNRDSFTARVVGNVFFADAHSASVDEIFYENAVYGKVNNFPFVTQSNQIAFINRYAPVAILDPDVYESVTLDGNIISFENAKGLEDWLFRDGIEFLEASGTAILNDHMSLAGFTYSVVFRYGSIRYELDYTTEFTDTALTLDKPNQYVNWRELGSPDVPMMVERAHGYLLLSDFKSVTGSKVVQCGAGNFSAMQQNELLYHRGDEILISDLNYFEIYNNSSGELISYFTGGRYEDGQFATFENDTEVQRVDLSLEDAEKLSVQGFTELYPAMTSLDAFYISEVQGGYVFDYTFSDSLAEVYRQNAQYFVFGEPQFLDLRSSGYECLLAEGYLAIDAYSGLPTAISVTYSATHTIDGEKYPLVMQITQSINAADRSTYTDITGEVLPAEEPVEEPTPLFYKVSGENGQQMWLLGTIHLGDERTAKLPREIKDAFADSDTLAVEFDMNDFSDQLMNDPELAESVLAEYLYLDGTMIADHLQMPDLYEAAVQTMKMTGQLQGTILYTKPVMWSQIIEEYYLGQGYELSADDGVDLQLLAWAEEQGKQIFNVESGMDQLKMLSGFSDDVQEMILASTLSIDPAGYNATQMELYDLWCEGDEQKLIAMMETDTSSMSQEELDLYEEYTKAMETDRNKQMLQVAIEYLESGDTVFFAVGLAHLLADDGLVNTLRDAGYSVELVAYS